MPNIEAHTKPHIKRYGPDGSIGIAGRRVPFAHAVEAGGWLHVSSQVPMVDGVIINGTIEEQTRQTITNLLAIVKDAGYELSDIVRCGVWLEDARDFFPFNRVFSEVFGEHLPARTSIVASMVIGCKVEMDCIAYKPERP
jgi:enamine deaminase RidA (YjgF/YER057c/UK114 family)